MGKSKLFKKGKGILNFVTDMKTRVLMSVRELKIFCLCSLELLTSHRLPYGGTLKKLGILGGFLALGSTCLISNSAYAAFYANVSRSGIVTLSEEGIDTIKPTSTGTLGTGTDNVSVATNCSAGYSLYVSATETGDTKLNLDGASDPNNEANYIITSTNTPDTEGTLAKDTWGVGKTAEAFSGLQDYSSDAGAWTALYNASSTDIAGSTTAGVSTLDYNVHFGANISTEKNPGSYIGNVLYTVIMDSSCTEYTLMFEDGTEDHEGVTNNLPNGVSEDQDGKGEYPKVKFGTTINLADYSDSELIKRSGHVLAGWKVKVGDNDPSEETYSTDDSIVLDDGESSEVTLIAQWEANKYTIHYNPNNPSGTSYTGTTADQTEQAYDSTISLRTNGFSITGYTFNGWSYTADGTKAFDNAQANVTVKTLTENAKPNAVTDTDGATINLYAVWTKTNYNLTVSNGNTTAVSSLQLSTNGGSFTTKSSGTATSIAYGTSTTVRCVPNSGYHCTQWTSNNTSLLASRTGNTAAGNYDYTFNMPAGAVTLTASGAANTYTIYYNANGGSGSTSSTTATYGSNVTLASNAFTAPSGKKFKSWGTTTAGGTTYSAGSSYAPATLKSNVTTTNGGSITLYAIWEDDACYPSATVGCKLADNRTWIYGNSGNITTWNNVFQNATGANNHNATIKSGICPSGYSAPTITIFDSLVQAYGGTSYSLGRSGYQESTGALYKALGLSDGRYFWSSTEYSSSGAYGLLVGSGVSDSSLNNDKSSSSSRYVLCYK